ncbi:hypothetical protein [Hymenobacter sp. CRA2]|uniref:hypothetical protein n=1 Tax=Hymenobacter sp. CRA2 TaxID=1955620 RepID=UPI00098FFE16|nr:hypothetical protein [Hymenobacter sp. CRA2]OON66937.1 hypothetical protein B0919_20345 [Hymenobacter sp. CRA2]
MKRIYSLAIAALLALPATAQTPALTPAARPHLLDFGLGTSLNGSGDYNCLKTHLGYTRTLSRHVSAGPRVSMISGTKRLVFGPADYLPMSYHAVNLEGEAYYAPFGNDRRVVFAVGVGAYAGYTLQQDFEWAGYGLDANGNRELQYKSRDPNGFHVGYMASLNLDLAMGRQQLWLLGLKAALQNDTYANILPGAQLRIARCL